jgi:hypothetical protein
MSDIECGFQSDPPDGIVATRARVWIDTLVWTFGIIVGGATINWLYGYLVFGRLIEVAAVLEFMVLVGILLILIVVIAVIGIIDAFHQARCGWVSLDDRPAGCWAGATNDVTASFSRMRDWIFPYAAHHSYLDVVVKSAYWPLAVHGAHWVHCAKPGEPRSYVLRTYFHDSAVCAAGEMVTNDLSVIVLFLAGFVSGVLAFAFISGSLVVACTTVILCPVAIIIAAFLIAIIVAVLVVLLLAAVLGNIGRGLSRAFGSERSRSRPNDPETGALLGIGDLITVSGRVYTNPDLDGANVGWFGDPRSVMLHGRIQSPPPYDHVVADTNLPMDGCPIAE